MALIGQSLVLPVSSRTAASAVRGIVGFCFPSLSIKLEILAPATRVANEETTFLW
jgi:hypothetical protein